MSWDYAWHAKVDRRAAVCAAVELGEFLPCSGEADLESFDCAQPAFPLGLGDAGDQVVSDLLQLQPTALGWVRPEERATIAGVFMNTRA
ncbi:hypothetical protein A6A06_37485 [Streptomyces sp. CB02923]|nr:hypothetical protein A6A06_37485 [Streptomyces sp. CB02923]